MQNEEQLVRFDEVRDDEELFMKTLEKVHSELGTRFAVPTLAGRKLDLHRFFLLVTFVGGYDKVVEANQWKRIANYLSVPSDSSLLPEIYHKLLLRYEQIYFFGSSAWKLLNDFDLSPTMDLPIDAKIDGKFENGFLLTATTGSEKFKGILYDNSIRPLPIQHVSRSRVRKANVHGKYKVGIEHSKVLFKHGDSKRQMPKEPIQVSDEHKRLKKSTFVKANDSEDARKGEVREEHQDRISQLPHAILVTILTFLPFRESVRTSVLSRKWRHNWTLNPNLNLLVADILSQPISTIGSLGIHSQVYQELGKKYVKIVDQVLRAYSMLKVDVFRVELFFVEGFACHLCKWLKHVFASGVEKLEITVPDNICLPTKPLILPCPFLSSNQIHLKHLLLRSCIITNFDSLVCFKFLKSLNLDCTILSNERLGRFLPNCVSLEWMRLTRCSGPKLTINYPSTKLKYLSIFPYPDVKEVEVYSKSLVTFELHGFFVHSIVIDAPSLVEAWFHVMDVHNSSLRRQKLVRLLSNTSQLQKLILKFFPLSENHNLVSILPQVLSTIINLKVLVLNISMFSNIDLRWVFAVTKNCPLLQELQLHLINVNKDESYQQIEVSDHTLSHLKLAEISGFFGHQSQIDLAIHLLKHAIVLESLIIHEATKKYLGEGNFSKDTFSCSNINRSKANSALKLLLDLAPPNLQLFYNYYDGSP